MRDLDIAVRDAVAVAAPPLPFGSIVARERRIASRGRRRNAFAFALLLLSIASVAFSGGHSGNALTHAPTPVASVRPAPAVT